MSNANSCFLNRLLKDASGNALAIAAAAFVPLAAAVGGTVDVSRYYMTSARLQNACDAGALAARKAMGDTDFSAEERAHGLAFFDQNYSDGTFGLENLTRDYVANTEGTVTGTASGDLPTALMGIFGYGDFEVEVSCSAEINISNSDIMFVLDVTGSMNCPVTSGSCTNNGNVEASDARIRALRTAVVSFYDAVDSATSSAAQVRFGIVPYASNVNVGSSIPSQYMAPTHTYQSREAQWEEREEWEFVSYELDDDELDFDEDDRENEFRNGTTWDRVRGIGNETACTAQLPDPIDAEYIEGSIDEDSIDVHDEDMDGPLRSREMTAEAQFFRGVPTTYWNNRRNRCYVGHERWEFTAEIDLTWVDRWVESRDFDEWIYKPVEYDVTNFYDGDPVVTETGNQGAEVTHTWTGCVEEANTVNTSGFDPVPAGANDLDINLTPSTASEFWKPQLPNAVYKREVSGNNQYANLTQSHDENRPGYDCPKFALRLQEMERDFLVNYLREDTGFDARSNTYHDLGMIWGARLISPRGMFATDNATAPNGDSIARHIVFMTDGTLSVNREIYNMYGVEWWDRRISSNTSTNSIAARHAERFQAACRQAREENISVWVVAFGTALSQNLIDCATPGRAYHADSSDALNDAFEEIAEKIASLRLTN